MYTYIFFTNGVDFAVKVDNDPSKKKMSKLGTEAQLLARLMEQARQAKMGIGGATEVVVSAAPGGGVGPVPADTDEEATLQARLNQRKRKATVGSSAGAEDAPSALPLGDAVTVTGLTVGEHVPGPQKKTKLVAAAPKDTRPSKLSIVAKEALLEDEGFIRHVAERLKSAGLDRMVQAQGSPRENRARAFDSILRGLHNLYLVDSLEEDVALKEQVATLEAGLLVERTEKKNVVRQRDSLKAKLESATGERDKLKARVADLEKREAAKCQALEEEVAGLKAKVAELPEVVARERKVAVEEALDHFRSSHEVAALKAAEYDRGFEAGYSQHFHTLIEKGWINVD